MVPHRMLVAAFVVVMLVCAIFSSLTRRTHHVRMPLPIDIQATVSADHDGSLDRNSSAVPDMDVKSEADGTIDLYGNDVTDAVARYSLDATGSLYEVHSPQTELPRLGSPQT